MLYDAKRNITRERLFKNFGCSTNITGPDFVISPPLVLKDYKPWLIFPPEALPTYERVSMVNGVTIIDAINPLGWIESTNTELAIPVVPTDCWSVFNLTQHKAFDNTQTLLLLTCDQCESIGYKSLKCQFDNMSFETAIQRPSPLNMPFITYDRIPNLFRLISSLPPDIYLNVCDLSQRDLKQLCSLFLGSIGDWRYTPRKLYVTRDQLLGINLKRLDRLESSVLLPAQLGLSQVIHFKTSFPNLCFTDNCMSAIVDSPAGIVIHCDQNHLFTFRENKILNINHARLELPSYRPCVDVSEDAVQKIMHIEALMGIIDIEVLHNAAVPQIIYSTVFFTIVADPDMPRYTCVTNLEWRIIYISCFSIKTVLQLLHHMLCVVALDPSVVFFLNFQGSQRELLNIIEIFICGVPDTAQTDIRKLPINFKIKLKNTYPGMTPRRQVGRHPIKVAISEWKLSHTPQSSNIIIPATQTVIQNSIQCNYTTVVKVTHTPYFITVPSCINNQIKTALALRYHMANNNIFLAQTSNPNAPLLAITDVPLDLRGFAFQREDPIKQTIDPNNFITRRNVITMNKVDFLEDAHVAAVCANLYLGVTLCGEALDATWTDLKDQYVIELNLKQVSECDDKIKQTISKRSNFYNIHYDEALPMGWLFGLLDHINISLKNPTECLMHFYKAMHPDFIRGVGSTKHFVAHEFRPCSTPGFIDVICATTKIVHLGSNIYMLVRNPSSSAKDVKFARQGPNKDIIRSLFQTHDYLERYTQLFGPVYVTKVTKHRVMLNGMAREVVVLDRVMPDRRTPGTMFYVNIKGVEYCLLTVGFSPLIMMDDRVAWVDLEAVGVVVSGTGNNWVTISETSGKAISKPSYGVHYTITRRETRTDILEYVTPDPKEYKKHREKCIGYRDVISDPIFQEFIQINASGVSTPYDEDNGIEELFINTAFVSSKIASYKIIPERGYVPSMVEKRTMLPGPTLVASLKMFDPKTEISFTYPVKTWYRDITLSTQDGCLIKWLTVLQIVQNMPQPLFDKGICILVKDEKTLSARDREIQPGVYIREGQIPWIAVITVTDLRLLFGVLLTATHTSNYIEIRPKVVWVQDLIVEFVLQQAPLFTDPKRIVLWGVPKPFDTDIILGPFTLKNVAIKLDVPVSLKRAIKSSNPPHVKWVTDDSYDICITETHLTFAKTGASVFIDRFMLHNLTKYILEKLPSDIRLTYIDPINPSGNITKPFWFDTVFNPLTFLTSQDNVYLLKANELTIQQPFTTASSVIDIVENYTKKDLTTTIDLSQVITLDNYKLATFSQFTTSTTLPREHLHYNTQSGLLWYNLKPNIYIRVITNIDDITKHGIRVNIGTTSLSNIAKYERCVVNRPVQIFKEIWFFHGLGGEEPCFYIKNASHMMSVCAAIRLFITTITSTTLSFRAINVILLGDHLTTDHLITHLSKPLAFDNVLKSIHVVYTPRPQNIDKQLRPTEITEEEKNNVSKHLYELKTSLLNYKPMNSFWRKKIEERPLAHDNRWIGTAWLVLPPNTVIDWLLSRQNMLQCTR